MKTILVIEDNKDVRENIEELLELSAYKVLTAADGKTGVEIATNQSPDLIICDIMMPVLDGYGVLHLLNRNKETFGIPFIFLTSRSEKADFRKSMEMGADDYLTKPFDGVELLNAVEVRLRKNEMLRANQVATKENVNAFIDTANQATNMELISNQREVYDFKKRHIVFTSGQKPKAVYYIIKGRIKTFKSSDDGKELITNIFTVGDFFGYTPILQDINYTDNAQVLEDTQLMVIPADDFLALLTTDMQIAKQFIKLIAKNVLEKEQMLVSLAYNSLRKKVAYGLMQVFDKYKKTDNNKNILEISRENLAQLVGVATESLIRTLADFKAEKMIDLQAGKVIILDEKKLRDLPY